MKISKPKYPRNLLEILSRRNWLNILRPDEKKLLLIPKYEINFQILFSYWPVLREEKLN